jgi:ACS family tartrate transporter-like MFS transporter
MASLSLLPSPLDRARAKAYRRLLPMLFLCYVIAYVDRNNVSIAFDTMKQDLNDAWVTAHGPIYNAQKERVQQAHDAPLYDQQGERIWLPFNNDVLGTGFGVFFIGYFLLEIPGTLLVERWSASKWISRIMISWGIVAALTALVGHSLPVVPNLAAGINHALGTQLTAPVLQFYGARFLLGLAEAGFFPGVIVYLTHWFPRRDRARALSWFLIGTPIAQFASPFLSYPLLKIGSSEMVNGTLVQYPDVAGLKGWQWVYIAWGIPAVLLGLAVLIYLTDRPHQARWLEPDERNALEDELERERHATRTTHGHMSWSEALAHPKVLLLAAAYFFIVTGNYGVESFLPTILKKWYSLTKDQLRLVLLVPALGSLLGQLFIGWSSDRTKERRFHAALPIYIGAAALACTVFHAYALAVMVILFALAATGLKAYLPAFWSLPSLFLTESAAASSIGLINSVGNLGGFIGPKVLGYVETKTGSFVPGILFLCTSMFISATIIITLGLGHHTAHDQKPPGPTEEITS